MPKLVALLLLLVGIGSGILIGYFGIPQSSNEVWEKIIVEADEGISEKLMNEISAANMKNIHRQVTI